MLPCALPARPRKMTGQADLGESIQPPPVTEPALGPNTSSGVQTGADVLPSASVPRTHTSCASALAKGPRAARTFSVGSSNAPSLAFIGLQSPPSIRTSAEATDEPPVAASSTVAVTATAVLTATGSGTAVTFVTSGAVASRRGEASGPQVDA